MMKYRLKPQEYTKLPYMHSSNLHEILILLGAAVLIVAVFKRLNLSPVLGYLVAGGAIGPFGIHIGGQPIVSDISTTRYIAEFGVVFLLFYIGLELTFERLKAMRVQVFGFGTAQMLLTGGAVGLIAHMFGASMEIAIIVGGSLALSSSAIVLQVLEERGEQATQVGRLSLATLILQDLAVVPLLIMVPLLAQENADLTGVILSALVKAVIAMVAIFLIGRLFLRPLFHSIGSLGSQELFTATTLCIVLGAAWATEQGGLSLALGAFLAGLMVAETEFRPQVQADIRPFKGLLLGLFFMTIGMSIDFTLLANKLHTVVLFTALLVSVKAVIITLLAKIFRFASGSAMQAGLLLAQGSEFAFVLFGLAASQGVLSTELAQILLIVVTISMAITPLLAIAGAEIARRRERRNPVHLCNDDISKETQDLDNHIIVAGYGRVGKKICQLLLAEDMADFIVVDADPKRVHEGRKDSCPVYYGSAARLDILESVGIKRAKMIAIMIRDRKASISIVQTIHQHYPTLPIVVRAYDREHARQLHEAGAEIALAETFESSLMLGKAVLQTHGIAAHEIDRVIDQFRTSEYAASFEKPVVEIKEVKEGS